MKHRVTWLSVLPLALAMVNLADAGFRCGGCSDPCRPTRGTSDAAVVVPLDPAVVVMLQVLVMHQAATVVVPSLKRVLRHVAQSLPTVPMECLMHPWSWLLHRWVVRKRHRLALFRHLARRLCKLR